MAEWDYETGQRDDPPPPPDAAWTAYDVASNIAGPYEPGEVQTLVEAALAEEGFDAADPRIAAEIFDAMVLAETPPPSGPTRPPLAAAPISTLLRHHSRGRSRAARSGTTRRRTRSGSRSSDDPLGDRHSGPNPPPLGAGR
jgi:hypothetical protein